MNKHILLKTLALAAFSIKLAAPVCAGDLPSRKDCIQGYQLLWKIDERAFKRKVLARIAEQVTPAENLAGFGFSPDQERVFFQFKTGCEQKLAASERIVAIWRQATQEDLRFKPIMQPIEPSIWTIELKGPAWKD